MADGRTVIFTFCFIAFFALLAGTIPAFMYQNQSEYDTTKYTYVNVPDKWDTSEIGYGGVTSQDYKNMTAGYGFTEFYLTLSTENDTTIHTYWASDEIVNIYVQHKHMYWIIPWFHNMNPYPIEQDYMIQIEDENVSSVNVICDRGDFQCLFQVGFDESSYANMTEAWEDGHLQFWFGIRTQDTQTQAHYDVWTMIGNFLTFRTPNIHWAINALVAIPFWAGIVYSILIILGKILPF